METALIMMGNDLKINIMIMKTRHFPNRSNFQTIDDPQSSHSGKFERRILF